MKEETGILYVSTGTRCNQECVVSAKSARKIMPSTPIALFTDDSFPPSDMSCFDQVNILPDPRFSFFDKIAPLKTSPFKKTLFVDTDTIFIDSVLEIFELLDRFDLAFCHASYRMAPGANNHIPGIPECFTEANTGVLAFNLCDDFKRLVDEWAKIYSEHLKRDQPPMHDQPAFKQAVYLSSISSYVLPPEYNMRTIHPVFKGGSMKAKILHGRGRSLKRAATRINSNEGVAIYNFRYSRLRVAITKVWPFTIFDPLRSTPLNRAIRKLAKRGV